MAARQQRLSSGYGAASLEAHPRQLASDQLVTDQRLLRRLIELGRVRTVGKFLNTLQLRWLCAVSVSWRTCRLIAEPNATRTPRVSAYREPCSY